MHKKLVIDQHTCNGYVHSIVRQMYNDNFKPDYIVGLSRGGLVPAVMLSQYLDIKMHTLNISFRDDDMGPESNLWMAEEAFGYVPYEGTELPAPVDRIVTDPACRKKILIVDDINDTGRTLNWIKEDWPAGCLPRELDAWNSVWNNNVRFATIVHNASSEFKDVDYAGLIINKHEDPCWVEFPWEEWWSK